MAPLTRTWERVKLIPATLGRFGKIACAKCGVDLSEQETVWRKIKSSRMITDRAVPISVSYYCDKCYAGLWHDPDREPRKSRESLSAPSVKRSGQGSSSFR